MQFPINTEDDTVKLARRLAPLLTIGDVVFLSGDLGMGKTTFARALIQSLMGKNTTVPSPTFTLMQSYDTKGLSIYHYDLYRLPEMGAEDDIIELGWEDTVNDGLVMVEWPDRLGDIIPQDRLEIIFTITANTRTITFQPCGQWNKERLAPLC